MKKVILRFGEFFDVIKYLKQKLAWYKYSYINEKKKMNFKGKYNMVSTASIRHGENIYIGNNSSINHNCVLWAGINSKIIINDNVLLGPNVSIFSMNHSVDKNELMINQPWDEADVVIGNDVWIGCNSIILKGRTVGEGAVIAAGAVITKDVLPYTIVAGNPARVIGHRK